MDKIGRSSESVWFSLMEAFDSFSNNSCICTMCSLWISMVLWAFLVVVRFLTEARNLLFLFLKLAYPYLFTMTVFMFLFRFCFYHSIKSQNSTRILFSFLGTIDPKYNCRLLGSISSRRQSYSLSTSLQLHNHFTHTPPFVSNTGYKSTTSHFPFSYKLSLP